MTTIVATWYPLTIGRPAATLRSLNHAYVFGNNEAWPSCGVLFGGQILSDYVAIKICHVTKAVLYTKERRAYYEYGAYADQIAEQKRHCRETASRNEGRAKLNKEEKVKSGQDVHHPSFYCSTPRPRSAHCNTAAVHPPKNASPARISIMLSLPDNIFCPYIRQGGVPLVHGVRRLRSPAGRVLSSGRGRYGRYVAFAARACQLMHVRLMCSCTCVRCCLVFSVLFGGHFLSSQTRGHLDLIGWPLLGAIHLSAREEKFEVPGRKVNAEIHSSSTLHTSQRSSRARGRHHMHGCFGRRCEIGAR